MSLPPAVLCVACGATTQPGKCSACRRPALLRERWALVAPRLRSAGRTSWDGRDAREGDVVVHALNAPMLGNSERKKVREVTPPGGDALAASAGTFVDGDGAAARVYVVLRAPAGDSIATLLTRSGEDRRSEALDTLDALLAMLQAIHGEGGRDGVACGTLAPDRIVRTADGSTRLLEPVHVLAFLARHGVVTEVDADAAPWQAPERLAGAAPSVQGDLYTAALIALAMASGGEPPRKDRREDDVAEMLWEADLSQGVRTLLQACVSEDATRRPESARVLRDQLREARGAAGDSPNRRLDFLDADEATQVVDRDAEFERALAQRSSATLPWFARPAFWIVLTAVMGSATYFSVSAMNPKPEDTPPPPTPEAVWAELRPGLASMKPPEALNAMLRVRADDRASPALRIEVREAEHSPLLALGRPLDAYGALREACTDAAAPRNSACSTLATLVVDGPLGVYDLSDALDALDAACTRKDTDACARRDRLERALSPDATETRLAAVLPSCGATDPHACARAGMLAETLGWYDDALSLYGAACATADADGCAGEAALDARSPGAARDAAPAKAEQACNQGSARGCFVRGQLEEGTLATASGGRAPRTDKAKVAKPAKSKASSASVKRPSKAPPPKKGAKPGPANDRREAAQAWYIKACDSGWAEACVLRSDTLAETVVAGSKEPQALLERACALDSGTACARLSEQAGASAVLRIRAASLGVAATWAAVLGDDNVPFAGIAQRRCEAEPETTEGLAACFSAAQIAGIRGDTQRVARNMARACAAGHADACDNIADAAVPGSELAADVVLAVGKRCKDAGPPLREVACGAVAMATRTPAEARKALEDACGAASGNWCLRAAAVRALTGAATDADRELLEKNATQSRRDGLNAAHGLAALAADGDKTLEARACAGGFVVACEAAHGLPSVELRAPAVAEGACTKEDPSACLRDAARTLQGEDAKAATRARVTLEAGCKGRIATADRASCGTLGWALATGKGGKADRARAVGLLERTCAITTGDRASCDNLIVLLAGMEPKAESAAPRKGKPIAPTAAALARARVLASGSPRLGLLARVRTPSRLPSDFAGAAAKACEGEGVAVPWLCEGVARDKAPAKPSAN